MAEHDWQSSKKTLRDRNAFMFNNHLMSDVKLLVSVKVDVERYTLIRVPAHKYILAISSPVFFAIFYGKPANRRNEIDLRDCDYHSVLEFLRCIYYDEVNLTLENAIGVMHIARKFLVPSLIKMCAAVLENAVNSKIVFKLLSQARKYNARSLERRCWEIVDKNMNECLQSDSVRYIDRETLVCLLKRESLVADEFEVFKAAWRWAKARARDKNLEFDGHLAREILSDALYYIRFPAMTREQFTECIAPSGILSDRENIMLYFYFTCKEAELDLPFPVTPRRQTLSVIRFSRYSDAVTNLSELKESNTSNFTDYLSFYTSQRIYMHGVRLFANYKADVPYEAEVRVIDDCKRELAFVNGMFYTNEGGAEGLCGFDVLLDIPVLIRKKSYCRLEAKLSAVEDSKIYKLQASPEMSVKHKGIEVCFEGQSTQVLELLL